MIQQVQHAISAIAPLLQRKDDVVINYDREADVLYLSFGKPKSADDTEMKGENFLIRKKGKSIVGITILNYKKSARS